MSLNKHGLVRRAGSVLFEEYQVQRNKLRYEDRKDFLPQLGKKESYFLRSHRT